jgi:hypothetical protein
LVLRRHRQALRLLRFRPLRLHQLQQRPSSNLCRVPINKVLPPQLKLAPLSLRRQHHLLELVSGPEA